MRGYWIHEDRSYTAWNGRRVFAKYAKPKCGHFNGYVGYKKKGKQPKRIDVTCGRCGQRVQFNPNTPRDGRGKNRQAWFKRQDDWTPTQIALFCQEQNLLAQLGVFDYDTGMMRPGKRQEGFRRASEWLQDNQADKGGDDE